jgi:hypothetical protein
MRRRRAPSSPPTATDNDISVAQQVSLEQKGNDSLHDSTPSENLHDNGRLGCASKRQQTTSYLDGGSECCDIVSRSVTLESDKMAEKKSDMRMTSGKCPSTIKEKTSIEKLTFTTTTTAAPATRILNLGPWICDACTYNNGTNITQNARCEMCNTVRPKVFYSDRCSSATTNDVEIVNIDC